MEASLVTIVVIKEKRGTNKFLYPGETEKQVRAMLWVQKWETS